MKKNVFFLLFSLLFAQESFCLTAEQGQSYTIQIMKEALGTVCRELGEPVNVYDGSSSPFAGVEATFDCGNQVCREVWYSNGGAVAQTDPDYYYFEIKVFKKESLAREWWSTNEPGNLPDNPISTSSLGTDPDDPLLISSKLPLTMSFQHEGRSIQTDAGTWSVFGLSKDVDNENILSDGKLWLRADRFVFRVGKIYRFDRGAVERDLRRVAQLLLNAFMPQVHETDLTPYVRCGGRGIQNKDEDRLEFHDVSFSVCLTDKLRNLPAAGAHAWLMDPDGEKVDIDLLLEFQDDPDHYGYGVYVPAAMPVVSGPLKEGLYELWFSARLEDIEAPGAVMGSVDHTSPISVDFEDGKTGDLQLVDKEGGTVDDAATSSRDSGEGLALVLAGHGDANLRYARLPLPLDDQTVQVDVCKVSGDFSGTAMPYGVIVRGHLFPWSGYRFGITAEGEYFIDKRDDEAYSQLVTPTASAHLRTGFNTWNTIKVVANGSSLDFYANNSLLHSLSDADIDYGCVILFSETSPGLVGPDVVQFDNLVVSQGTTPPPDEACIAATLSPQAAVDAGARWRVNGGGWLDDVTTATVVPGEHMVEFKDTPGFETPDPVTIKISLARTATPLGAYQAVAGGTPDIAVAPGAHDFGGRDVGDNSPAQTFTIENTGAAVLNIAGVHLTPESALHFYLAAHTCAGAELAPGETCSVDVSHQPGTEGIHSGELVVTSSDTDTPVLRVSLSGSGNTSGVPPPPGPAIHNVSTAAQLQTALDTAETNGKDDLILLAAGTYRPADIGDNFLYALSQGTDSLTIRPAEGAAHGSVIFDGENGWEILILRAFVSDASIRLENLVFRNNRSPAGGVQISAPRGALVGS